MTNDTVYFFLNPEYCFITNLKNIPSFIKMAGIIFNNFIVVLIDM